MTQHRAASILNTQLVKTKMETLLLSLDEVNQWRIPDFQRPLRVNDKVRALAETLKGVGGIMPGVITLGILPNSPVTYLVDGQHRAESFRLSGLMECIADVRTTFFASVADMAEEFVNLNSNIVNMRPDDLLRGLEATLPGLQKLRQGCPIVGYTGIRRGSTATKMLSMSATLRAWSISSNETPQHSGGKSALQLAHDLDVIDAECLTAFLSVAHAAWGTETINFRLWGGLNLTMCMWLWRRLVVDRERGMKRYVVLTAEQFKQCLMSVSANVDFMDWLVGRALNERDRTPCYSRLKIIFSQRLSQQVTITSSTGKKIMLPQPAWAIS